MPTEPEDTNKEHLGLDTTQDTDDFVEELFHDADSDDTPVGHHSAVAIIDPDDDSAGHQTLAAQRARRHVVHGPREAPSVQEVLLDPSRGHTRPSNPLDRVAALMRAQRRMASMLAGGFLGLVVLYNVVLTVWSGLGEVLVVGVPVQWLVPVVVFIPLLLVASWVFVRRTEAQEHEFVVGRDETRGVMK